MLPASALPQVHYAEEPAGLEVRWHELAGVKTASHKIWMDAYLAAFALTQNIGLLTLDQGFRNFEKSGLQFQLLAQ